VSEPRLLREVSSASMSFDDHCRVHGEPPGLGADRNAERVRIAEELTRSGLRGRGGAGFPLAVKLDAVRRARGTPVLVVNAGESEPMSAKDRTLLRLLPHLVIDGAICCARAAGASEIVFVVDEFRVGALEALARALHERPEPRDLSLRIVQLPTGYVSSQETSIVSFLNGGQAKPMAIAPRITVRGVSRCPTLVCNAETLAHAALIARHGARWFRQAGTDEEPGTTLITLSGAVRRPGVYEVDPGSELPTLLNAAGGPSEPLEAFLAGGYSGGFIDAAAGATARISHRWLTALGASLGSGIIVALPRSACPVAETTRVALWMSDQSAGQCGPCVNGLAAISDALADIAEGVAGTGALRDIQRWSALASGRGACAHPDGTVRFVTSALRVFADDFEDHASHGLCEACERPPVLRTATLSAMAR
jgi:NADH:ubiquinone oxidoreductase subunit F (NADH-binding)